MAKSVMIDGLEYVPISESNPNAQQIARAIMEQFWGEMPGGKDWEHEAKTLFVSVTEDGDDGGRPTVLSVVGRVLARTTPQSR